MKKVILGAAIALGGAALAYVGLVAYATHAVSRIKLGNLHDEQEVE